jgi:hypothetical protein
VDGENFSLDQETDGQSAIHDALNNPLDDNQSLDSDDQVSSFNHE